MTKGTPNKNKQARIRIDKRSVDQFSRVPRRITDDPALTLAAKGLMAYLLGKAGDWNMNVVDIMRRNSVKEHTTRKVIKELREAGYIKLGKESTAGGKIVKWIYLVSDEPIYKPGKMVIRAGEDAVNSIEKPQVEKHDLDDDIANRPLVVCHHLNKTEEDSNKIETPPDPAGQRANEFIAAWIDSYKEAFGLSYEVEGKDAGQAMNYFKRNRKHHSELIALAIASWGRRKAQPRPSIEIQNSVSIAGFLTSVNKLRLAIPNGIAQPADHKTNDNQQPKERNAW